MMKWIQLAIYAVRMILRYGPKLWALGKEIYDDLEKRRRPDNTPLGAEEKATVFNHLAERAVADTKGIVPRRPVLNRYREDVWQYRNPGKRAKRLADARLRYGLQKEEKDK